MKFRKQIKARTKYAVYRSTLRFDRRIWEESLELIRNPEFLERIDELMEFPVGTILREWGDFL